MYTGTDVEQSVATSNPLRQTESFLAPEMRLIVLICITSKLWMAGAVCFVEESLTVARTVLSNAASDSLADCKLACLLEPTCEYALFATTACLQLGAPVSSTQACPAPYTAWRKVTSNCPRWDVIADYAPGSCTKTGVLSPEYTRLEQSRICPNMPVEGETDSRLYLASVIFANGTHHSFDNDDVSTITWDAARSAWFFLFAYGGARIEEEIYAVTCTAQATADPTLCGCAPLPLHEGTASLPGATALSTEPAPLCAAGMNATVRCANSGDTWGFDKVSEWMIRCRDGLWIIGGASLAGGSRVIAVASGTCYTA